MASDSSVLIRFRNADILGGDNVVVSGLDMDIFRGDFAYIVGKVGTGKTSIIKTIIAENRLSKGECTVCGFDVANIRESQIPMLRRKIGVVFQDFQLLTDRSVRDNLAFVLKATGWKNDRIDRRIDEVLSSVGMETKGHKMPYQLSGGEQQRIAIARAILNTPEIIIADEPTGNLDGETADGIMKLLVGLNRNQGTTIVMVTHNRAIFEKYRGRTFVCRDEKCTESTDGEVIDLAIRL